MWGTEEIEIILELAYCPEQMLPKSRGSAFFNYQLDGG